MKKTFLFITAIAFTFFIISCGGQTTDSSSDSETNDEEEVVIKADPPKTAEELREIDKINEDEMAELENLDEVIRFSSNYSLTEFPMIVLQAKNLQTLELNNYRGTSLPEDLKFLDNLSVIYISGATKLAELPAFLAELKSLKTISITAANNLDLNAAFKVLSQCENLENIQITYSEIESDIPAEIGNLKNLKILDISHNMIKSFPSEFFTLPHLYSLNIASNEDYRYNYDELFENLKDLPELGNLVIYYSGLSGLPDVFNEYPSLSRIQWREEGAGWSNEDEILSTTEKWNNKFPNVTITWSTGSSMFYDYY